MKLKKITIANLNPDEMENINGGSFIAGTCDITRYPDQCTSITTNCEPVCPVKYRN